MSADTSPAVEFANTVYAVRGKLKDGLPIWLERHGHPTDATDAAETADFTALRDAVRALIGATVSGEAYPAPAVATVNAASAAAPFWLELSSAAPEAEEKSAASGVQAELGAIARDAIVLLAGEDREALRSCQAPGCVQFFMKTHPRQEFCGPVCGNRARAARHYARHKAE